MQDRKVVFEGRDILARNLPPIVPNSNAAGNFYVGGLGEPWHIRLRSWNRLGRTGAIAVCSHAFREGLIDWLAAFAALASTAAALLPKRE